MRYDCEMKIVLIPIDNRPVCYQLPLFPGKIDKSLEIIVPPFKMLGDLKKQADIEGLFSWLETIKDADCYVIALDTLIYGGLISSRRCDDSLEILKNRLNHLKISLKNKKIFAFSSIMRISNNNINEEEKPYWNKWGKKIFDYSYHFHRYGETKTDVPSEILKDYLETRHRNFEINKQLLKMQKQGFFDTLIFSKDDCAEYGLNVMESEELASLGATVKTGADEIPLTLLARAIPVNMKIKPIFTEPDFKSLISNYEDISIFNCVKSQISLAECEIDENNPDLILVINNFREKQGEIVMKIPTEPFSADFKSYNIPYAVADVRFANGADNAFIKKFLTRDMVNFIGYAGWNTSANTLGSLIFALKVIFYARKNGNYDEENHKKWLLTRFLDDWAYQANVRQELNMTDVEELSEKMQPYENILAQKFDVNYKLCYSFPWSRLFEVKIDIK